MKKHINLLVTISFFTLLAFISGCKKDEYSFGTLKTPTNVTLTPTLVGATATAIYGDSTGRVNFLAKATDALQYKIDYGDGTSLQISDTGVFKHQYNNALKGLYDYIVTINAIGTGGSTSTLSKKISVYTSHQIPVDIITALTNNSTRTWVTDKNATGHFGVGPNTEFAPIWYAAAPNTREACAYDDEITFSTDGSGRIFINVDNKGASFIIGAATSFYGLSGGDNCYSIATSGVKLLGFAQATSGSTPANSTGEQFTVPGNGIINFATGSKTYEILAASDTKLFLRNIGADGNSWYQKLIAK
jgi:hypothetical protein